jgi:hypothetical protein
MAKAHSRKDLAGNFGSSDDQRKSGELKQFFHQKQTDSPVLLACSPIRKANARTDGAVYLKLQRPYSSMGQDLGAIGQHKTSRAMPRRTRFVVLPDEKRNLKEWRVRYSPESSLQKLGDGLYLMAIGCRKFGSQGVQYSDVASNTDVDLGRSTGTT